MFFFSRRTLADDGPATLREVSILRCEEEYIRRVRHGELIVCNVITRYTSREDRVITKTINNEFAGGLIR